MNNPEQPPQPATRMDDAPHTGNMIAAALKARGLSQARLARKTGRDNSGLGRLAKRHSIQTDTLWEMCHALRYNFFADLAAALPPDYQSTAPPALQAELDETKAALEKMRIERDVLMRLMGK